MRSCGRCDPDYVAEFGLSPEHIPALIEIARQWADDSERPQDETVYSPVHAWRALGQLKAAEAVASLLGIQNRLDVLGDDWYLDEFHDVFGLIGLAVLRPRAGPQQGEMFVNRLAAVHPRKLSLFG